MSKESRRGRSKRAKKARQKAQTIASYAHRQAVLLRLGFKTYSEYLRSELWAEIRIRVLERDGSACRTCGSTATQVHHLSYGDVTLRGDKIDRLVSLCWWCHRRVETTPQGRKLPFDLAKKKYAAMVKKAERNRA